MDEQDAQAAFEELRRIVDDSALRWVLGNVDDEIHRGRPGTRTVDRMSGEEISTFDETMLGRSGRSRRIESFTTVTPFTASEKLDLLVAAVERVLTEIPSLQEHALHEFREHGAQNVRFADDTSESEFLIEPSKVPVGAAADLVGLLRQFRE